MEIALHVGAHRTGSTAFQLTLARNRAALARAGQAVWIPKDVRDTAFGYLAPGAQFEAAAREAFADAARATGADRLILSEENMLGSMRRNLQERAFYTDAAARLAAYHQLFGAAPVRIGLGIRDYASYWASVYTYLLPRQKLAPFEVLKPAFLDAGRGWRDIVRELRVAFPHAEIVVWALEAVQGRVRDVVARFVGCAPEELRAKEARSNQSLGPDAIPFIEAARAVGAPIDRVNIRAALAALPEAERGQISLFSLEEKLALTQRYAEDFAAFEAGFEGVEFIGSAGEM